MKNLPAFSLFVILFVLGIFGTSGLALGQDGDDFKVAGVDVQRVFQEFHKTSLTEEEVNEERIRIHKADRQLRAQIKGADEKIREQNKKGGDAAVTDEDKKAHSEKMTLVVEERNKMNQERIARYEASNGQLNRALLETMKGLLGEIQRFVEAHSASNGYDVVFDLSGTTSNQTPPVFGGKGVVDITATVIAELNKKDSN